MIIRSIKVKFLLVFVTLSLIPLIIVAMVSYYSYTNLVSKQVSLVSANTLSNSVDKISNVLKDIDRVSGTFVYQQFSSKTSMSTTNNTIADQLAKYTKKNVEHDQYTLYSTGNDFKFLCDNLMYNYNYIKGVYIFTPGENTFSYGNELKLDYKPFNSQWYINTIKNNGKLYISDVSVKDFIYNTKVSLTFSRALFDTNTHEFLGVLMLDCGIDVFKDLDKDIIPNLVNIFIINGSGKIIFDNTNGNIGKYLSKDAFSKILESPENSFTNANGSVLTVYKSFPNYDWKVVTTISITELNKEFYSTKKLLIHISLICAAIIMMLSFILSTYLTTPISELSEIMNKNKSHKLVTTKKHLERRDEIGVLYNEYNDMIEEINIFIKESYQNKLITLDSQMKALESQINSHFLYNTLESINSIAEIEEIESIAIISKALGDMFRYAIKTNSELVTLKEELSHVNNYLEIQKIRYGDKLNYSFEIQENLKEEKILKLILQPLVENAIYHGLEGKKNNGKLHIGVWSEDNLIFLEISDNGLGASLEKIDEINKLLRQAPKFMDLGRRDKQSIGMKNVHSRIDLYYGSGYGLTFESLQNFGTKIKIHIPKLLK